MEPKRIDIESLNSRLIGTIKEGSEETPIYTDSKNTFDNNQPKEYNENTGNYEKEKEKNPQAIDIYNNQASNNYNLQVDLDATDLRNKIQGDDKTIDIFLRNLFPVVGINILRSIENAGNTEPKLGGTLSLVSGAFNAIVQSRYLTPSELVIYLGSNFYTLHFVRGITIKKFTGFFGSSWTGYPDLTFGRNYIDILPSLSDVLGDIEDVISPQKLLKREDNKEIEDAKERTSPLYAGIIGQGGSFYRQVLGSDPLSKGNRRVFTPITSNIFTYKNLIQTSAGKWIDGGILTSNVGRRGDHDTNSEHYILNNKVNNLQYKDLESRDGKWAESNNRADWDRKPKKHTVEPAEYLINEKVTNISLPNDENGGVNDIENYRPDLWSIGYILVMPQTRDGSFSNYKIPFEFNPSISTGGVSTQYNAQTILSRIGALQTFSHVELSTVDISTKYYALKDQEQDGDNRGSVGHGWMDIFTLNFLQGIQSGYEALSYPFFPSNEQQNIEKGFKYVKPPLIKVVIGEAGEGEEAPYSNLLTYPQNIAGDNTEILASSKEKILYKTFIVSSVNIEKNLEETPLYIKNKKIKDAFGFTVSLSLVEITKSYMDVMPNYENYFNHFESMINNEDLIDNG
jgi:hypothetical protein